MLQDQFDSARDLIRQKRYDEAREILLQIDHPKAKEWLTKLDQLPPSYVPPPSSKADLATDGGNRLPVSNVFYVRFLTVLSLLMMGIVSYGVALLSQQRISNGEILNLLSNNINNILSQASKTMTFTPSPSSKESTATITPTPFLTPIAETLEWEYLLVQYSQSPALSEGDSPMEYGFTSQPVYDKLFEESNKCFVSFDRACAKVAFKGQVYYLDAVGKDGWQIVSVIDKSGQYSYQVEVILMRPKK